MWSLPSVARCTLRVNSTPILASRVADMAPAFTVVPRSYSTVSTADEGVKRTRTKKTTADGSGSGKGKGGKLEPWQARDEAGNFIPLPQDRKPVHSTSPYFFLLRKRAPEMRSDPSVQKVSPTTGKSTLDIVKFGKHVSLEWRNMSASERAPYHEQAEEDRKRYKKEFEAWEKTITREDIRRQNLFNQYLRKQGKTAPGNLRDPAEPRKPATAFFRFLSQLRARGEGQDQPATEFSAAQGKIWRNMSAEAKAPFEAEFAEAKQKYDDAIRRYKQ